MRRLTWWLAVLSLVACGGAGTNGGGAARPSVAQVEVSPRAALLTGRGEQALFRAEAFAQDGQPVTVPVIWTSSNAEAVSIAADGRVTAGVTVGSSQITATVGGVVSEPVLVLVAAPAPGAVLVSDAEVVAGPTPVDENAALDENYRLRLTLTPGVAVAPGAILLARESKPVGGRVLSAQPQPTGATDVVIELVPLPLLFRRLELDDSYHLDPSSVLDAQKTSAAADGGLPGRELRSAQGAAPEPGGFRLGPFDCVVGTAFGTPVTGDIRLRLEPDVTITRHLALGEDGQLTSLTLAATGTLKATGTVSLRFSPGFEGSLSCKYLITKVPIPLAGALSIIGGLQIPVGLKGEIKASVATNLVEAGGEIKANARTSMGIAYTPETGLVPIAEVEDSIEIKPTFSLTESGIPLVVTVGIGFGPTVGLDVGFNLPLLGAASLSLVDGSVMAKAEASMSPWIIQILEPARASSYEAKVALGVGPGKSAAQALTFLGGAVAIKPAFSIEKKLARSPTGSLTADRQEVAPGGAVDFRVRLDRDSTTFFGVANVDQIRIYHRAPGQEDPEVIATLGGGADATWSWNPGIGDLGYHEFWAATVSVLVPLLPLEVTADSRVPIHVGYAGGWRGELSFRATGASSETTTSPAGQTTVERTLTAGGQTMVKQVQPLYEGGLLEATAATADVSLVETTTFVPNAGSPGECRYGTRTQTTTTGSTVPLEVPTVAVLSIAPAAQEYTIVYEPPSVQATMEVVTTQFLVSGPDTCVPSGPSTSTFPATFDFASALGSGPVVPPGTITGEASFLGGSQPEASYEVEWHLSFQ